MTREEAIKMLRGMKADNLNLNDLYTRDKYEALVMAIKALEQEPIDCKAQLRADRDRLLDVLDKIRAEIEQLPTQTRTNWNGCCPDIDYPEIEYVDVIKHKLLSIIDKYKAESEVTDADSN